MSARKKGAEAEEEDPADGEDQPVVEEPANPYEKFVEVLRPLQSSRLLSLLALPS